MHCSRRERNSHSGEFKIICRYTVDFYSEPAFKNRFLDAVHIWFTSWSAAKNLRPTNYFFFLNAPFGPKSDGRNPKSLTLSLQLLLLSPATLPLSCPFSLQFFSLAASSSLLGGATVLICGSDEDDEGKLYQLRPVFPIPNPKSDLLKIKYTLGHTGTRNHGNISAGVCFHVYKSGDVV